MYTFPLIDEFRCCSGGYVRDGKFGNLLAGAVIVETVFSRPGLGRVIVGAILAKDFPLVQGAVLFVATGYVLINALVDIAYGFVDPRIRVG